MSRRRIIRLVAIIIIIIYRRRRQECFRCLRACIGRSATAAQKSVSSKEIEKIVENLRYVCLQQHVAKKSAHNHIP